MKQIIFRIDKFPQPSQTFITEQIVIAIKIGYKVRVLVDEKGTLENSTQNELIAKYDILSLIDELPKLYGLSPFMKTRRFLKALFQLPFSSFRLLNPLKYGVKALKANEYIDFHRYINYLKQADIIHIQFGTNHRNLDLFKSVGLVKCPIITTFHGYDVNFTEIDKSTKIEYYKLLFKEGNLFTCNTSYLRDKLVEINCPQEKLKIVHVPIDTAKFRPSDEMKSNETIRLLSIGRLVKIKGFEFGIRAVNELKKKGVPFMYEIIGDGPERENLSKLILDLDLSNEVKLLGRKSQSEIVEFLQKVDLFLMTSVIDKNGRREAQGLVSGEAQACGVPVIAFDSGGVKFTLVDQETGLLCEELNYFEMAEKLEKLIVNEALRKEMSISARKFMESKFSSTIIEEKWKSIYDSISNN